MIFIQFSIIIYVWAIILMIRKRYNVCIVIGLMPAWVLMTFFGTMGSFTEEQFISRMLYLFSRGNVMTWCVLLIPIVSIGLLTYHTLDLIRVKINSMKATSKNKTLNSVEETI